MKSILCFGDSLTWGYDPEPDGIRHPFEMRWPGALELGLNGKARVVEEGLPGRTTVFESSLLDHHNGKDALPMMIESHAPLDLVIIMLGTNDLQRYLNGDAFSAARGVRRLVALVHEKITSLRTLRHPNLPMPEIMIISPPEILDTAIHPVGYEFFAENWAQSQHFSQKMKSVADEMNTHFFDAAEIVTASQLDGVHLSATETQKLGQALISHVKDILKI